MDSGKSLEERFLVGSIFGLWMNSNIVVYILCMFNIQ